jgi:hypothetical protein
LITFFVIWAIACIVITPLIWEDWFKAFRNFERTYVRGLRTMWRSVARRKPPVADRIAELERDLGIGKPEDEAAR